MAAVETQRLDVTVAEATGQLADRLLAPIHETLATLEGTFPGITERVTEIINPEKVRGAITADVARSIDALMTEGTEESLTLALAKLADVRMNLEKGGPALTKLLAEGRVHLGEAYEKVPGLTINGVIPTVTEDLARRCLEQPVKSMIVLDAGHSLIEIEQASIAGGGFRMFLGDVARQRDFASATHAEPRLVIVPMEVCNKPKTTSKTKDEQLGIVRKAFGQSADDQEIGAVRAREISLGILLHQRTTGEILLKGVYTRVEESNAVVGDSGAAGFYVDADYYYNDGVRYDSVAVAPRRNQKS